MTSVQDHPDEPKYTNVEQWEIVSLMPLPPGWFNIFGDSDEDPRTSRWAYPCPAIMVQKLVSTTRMKIHPDGRWTRSMIEAHEKPYQTRAVFVENGDGNLWPADDTSNYLRTDYRPDLPPRGGKYTDPPGW